MSTTRIPPEAREAAVRMLLRRDIEDRCDQMLDELDSYLAGDGDVVLDDARDLLTGTLPLLDALEQFGPGQVGR